MVFNIIKSECDPFCKSDHIQYYGTAQFHNYTCKSQALSRSNQDKGVAVPPWQVVTSENLSTENFSKRHTLSGAARMQ